MRFATVVALCLVAGPALAGQKRACLDACAAQLAACRTDCSQGYGVSERACVKGIVKRCRDIGIAFACGQIIDTTTTTSVGASTITTTSTSSTTSTTWSPLGRWDFDSHGVGPTIEGPSLYCTTFSSLDAVAFAVEMYRTGGALAGRFLLVGVTLDGVGNDDPNPEYPRDFSLASTTCGFGGCCTTLLLDSGQFSIPFGGYLAATFRYHETAECGVLGPCTYTWAGRLERG